MESSAPRIDTRKADSAAGHEASARVLGRWTAGQFASKHDVRAANESLRGTRPDQAWDLREAVQIDHIGAQMLWNHWGRRWPEHIEALPAQRAVLDRVAEFTKPAPPPAHPTLMGHVAAFGTGVFVAGRHIRGFVRLIGQLVLNLRLLARAPHHVPWRDVSGHLYHIGARALPITALVGFLIGITLAYLTAQQLKQFGADAYIVNILGVSLIRELGPMLAAILVAGRSGSAITAQIGVMRVTEELDAMRVMGISHSYRLVMPRAVALAIAMPLISVWTTLAALAGGMVSADLSMGITPHYFVTALPAAASINNLYLATAKSVVFGILIALIGCHFGLRVKPNTQSLGEGTTTSVVAAITAVILVDALFAVMFKDVSV